MLLLVVFVFLVLFVLVPPVPVLSLLFSLEALVVDIRLMALFQPMAISLIFALIPVVIIPVVGVIDPSPTFFALFPFVSLVIVLWSGDGPNPYRRYERRRHKQRSQIFISTMHNNPPAVAH
jgi:hypothetical protein